MTPAEQVVKALREHCTCPRVAGMECGDCAKWDALADYVEKTEVLLYWTTYSYPAPDDEITAQMQALARLAEVMGSGGKS